MGLLQRIGEIWTGSPHEEALRMVDDFRFDYAAYVNEEDFLYIYDLVQDRMYESAFYAIQEYDDVIHESDLRLFLRILEEASNV